jgi:single-stranded DNA-specific DHH superfamily exonuclease
MFEAARDGLLGYGGHHAAGGFAVSDEQVHTLPEMLGDMAFQKLSTVLPEEEGF